MTTEPRAIGVWIIAVTDDGELIHWGTDGDTDFPLSSKAETDIQLRFIANSHTHKTDRIYVQTIFSNGQQKTEESDRSTA